MRLAGTITSSLLLLVLNGHNFVEALGPSVKREQFTLHVPRGTRIENFRISDDCKSAGITEYAEGSGVLYSLKFASNQQKTVAANGIFFIDSPSGDRLMDSERVCPIYADGPCAPQGGFFLYSESGETTVNPQAGYQASNDFIDYTVFAEGKTLTDQPLYPHNVAAVSENTLGAISMNNGSEADLLIYYGDAGGVNVAASKASIGRFRGYTGIAAINGNRYVTVETADTRTPRVGVYERSGSDVMPVYTWTIDAILTESKLTSDRYFRRAVWYEAEKLLAFLFLTEPADRNFKIAVNFYRIDSDAPLYAPIVITDNMPIYSNIYSARNVQLSTASPPRVVVIPYQVGSEAPSDGVKISVTTFTFAP